MRRLTTVLRDTGNASDGLGVSLTNGQLIQPARIGRGKRANRLVLRNRERRMGPFQAHDPYERDQCRNSPMVRPEVVESIGAPFLRHSGVSD
jgi:hypothetical protein